MASTQWPEVAVLFLRLGIVSFGGPAAHTALMYNEVVRRRAWLTEEEFLDLVSAANLIPGPNSTELAIHVGYRRAGWRGLVAGGLCFIVPPAMVVAVCAWAYLRYGTLPEAEALLYGIKPAIIAIVVYALVTLGRVAIKNWLLAGVAAAGIALRVLGTHELLILFGAGLCYGFGRWARPRAGLAAAAVPMGLLLQGGAAATVPAAGFSLGALFLFFVKVGSVLFGSGYVLLAFLRADLVQRWGWLTEAQLLDAIAIGQTTPGPLFTTATFIGYFLGGPAGALLATAGIFLPAFLFVAISGPLIPRLRQSRAATSVLDGINAAALALMAVVGFELARAALIDAYTMGIAMIGALVLIRFRINAAWLVFGSAAAGWLLR